ncbi:OmpA family protein [uncultured Draconibacterium sp.]|uniref:OmpA family protein n=1 Tax=uncultured Draconibacterium sp. TaxID=1573823 RepID=UPI0029C7D92C|nr:OmpA family protein [uncultured Draconibacterium sp.]
MKKFLILFIVLLMGANAYSQTPDKKWGLGLGAGAYYNNGLEKFGVLPQFSLARYLNPSFDATFQTELGFIDEQGVDGITDLANFSLNLKYKLNNGYIFKENSTVKPYVYAGPTYLFDNKTDGFDVHGGAGTKIMLSKKFDLFVEGGYIEGLKPDGWDESDSHWKATIGVVYNFKDPKDSDLDGVWDRNDECPNTPAGVIVDENGCPVDTDGDGIADYKDECPDEIGLAEFNGCPDTDGDGIPDKNDDCPKVAGLAKFSGCPDTDKDGVPDNKDKCPGTPEGWTVDANGCAVDSDGDGVADAEDNCPNVAGPAINNGCPLDLVPKVFKNFTPVLFDTDEHFIRQNEIIKLDAVVIALRENEAYNIHIFGHADERATEAYNQKLSEERAAEIAKYFRENGISDSRIVEVKGYGELRPVVPNTSAENRQKNRRVEIDFDKE